MLSPFTVQMINGKQRQQPWKVWKTEKVRWCTNTWKFLKTPVQTCARWGKNMHFKHPYLTGDQCNRKFRFWEIRQSGHQNGKDNRCFLCLLKVAKNLPSLPYGFCGSCKKVRVILIILLPQNIIINLTTCLILFWSTKCCSIHIHITCCETVNYVTQNEQK